MIALREPMLAMTAGLQDVVLAVGTKKLCLHDTSCSIPMMSTNTDVKLVGSLGFQFTGSYPISFGRRMKEYG